MRRWLCYGLIVSVICWTSAVAFTTKLPRARVPTQVRVASNRKNEAYSVATQLLSVVLREVAQKKETASAFDSIIRQFTQSYRQSQKKQKNDIEYLTKLLCEYENAYDPTESLLGPFYSTVYTFTPSKAGAEPPLWEKISLRKDNLKGQQYFLNRDFEKILVNYAQIWGKNFAIRAQGRFELVENSEKSRSSNKNPLAKLFPGKRTNKRHLSLSKTKRPCPDIFNLRVFAAEFILGGLTLPIPIEGAAKIVVLYADPRIRIIMSPENSDSAVGPWEKSGLVALQVRGDLIAGEYLDLR